MLKALWQRDERLRYFGQGLFPSAITHTCRLPPTPRQAGLVRVWALANSFLKALVLGTVSETLKAGGSLESI